MTDISVRTSGPDGEDRNNIEVWGKGFQTNVMGGVFMACEICAALVGQSPGDGRRHLEWHQTLKSGG